MIQNFINDLCDILKISTPAISYDTSNFPTTTMMAQLSPSGKTLYLRRYDEPNADQFFSIAHELRHAWQIQNDKQFYFSTYKPVNLMSSIEEYNLQIAEIDANAFAYIVMVDFFGMKPLFHGLSDNVKSRILDRVEYLKRVL